MEEIYVKNEDIIIRIVGENTLLEMIKKEYSEYYLFYTRANKRNFNIFIYIDTSRYKQILKKLYISNKNLIYLKDRNGIIVKKSNNDIFILYDKITDNLVQFIGENIISIFGLYMEKRGYIYFHAACVEKDTTGIAIIGERNSGKTTILNILLQEGFNFVSNSHLGVKKYGNDLIGLGSPSRMGIRLGTLSSVLTNKNLKLIIENTEFKYKFSNDIKNNLSLYNTKKFNIKINELKEIYKINLVNKTNIKFILVPIYMPEIEHLQIKELNEEEKMDILLKNRRKGSYDTIIYIDDLFNNRPNNLFDIETISMYKIYQNEKNINELLSFIYKKIEMAGDNN